MGVSVGHFETYLPSKVITNAALTKLFPEWSVEKIAEKTGIYSRHIADENEFSSSLAIAATEKLFTKFTVDIRDEIDSLIVVSQTPDYFLPGIGTSIHQSVGLRQNIPTFDLNQGCSGYVGALSLATAMIESNQANKILLVTADTYSKLISPEDKSVRTIFGDGATASIVERTASDEQSIYAFVHGTDGSGSKHLIVKGGALRDQSESLDIATRPTLQMNGPEVFNFTLRVADAAVTEILRKSNSSMDEVDFFVFHQANEFMLRHLREKIGIPEHKFPILMSQFGNTVSSTIPMALEELSKSGKLTNKTVLLLGFGVGLAWSGCLVRF